MEQERLQKVMAQRGICSRRKAEELIAQGKVKVNGETITELGYKCFPDVDIQVIGLEVSQSQEEKVTFVINKPMGVLCTASDDRGRTTVVDFFKKEPYRLYPVGRLDFNTSGCLLVTNDGELSQLVTHPSSHMKKTYIVTCLGNIPNEKLRMLRDGILLEDGMTQKAEILVGKRNDEVTIFKIIITEGRNRQVRRMCEAIGYEVKSLHRESVGKITLGNLKRGEYRKLTPEEVEDIKKTCLENKKNNVIPDYKKKTVE